VGARRGGRGRLFAVVLVLSLIRWSSLRGTYERLWPPGEGNKNYVHVVCPYGCGNEAWVTRYSVATVKTCGRHEGGRVRMVRCQECLANPGRHPPKGRR
jgi:hypothetical protein